MTAIKQGNTGPLWRIGVPEFDTNGLPTGNYIDLSQPGWACTMAVPSAGTPISRAVTDLSADNFRFFAQLTPTETDDLAARKTHVVAIEVVNPNTTPPFKVEYHVELEIEPDLI